MAIRKHELATNIIFLYVFMLLSIQYNFALYIAVISTSYVFLASD